MNVVQPAAELLDLVRKQGQPVVAAISELLEAVALEQGPAAVEEATENLARRLAELMGLANILARRRVELAAERLEARAAAAPIGEEPAGLLPRVTWFDAVTQIADRYPAVVPPQVHAMGSVEVQRWIGALYESQALTLARTSQSVVVKHVQDVLKRAQTDPRPKREILRSIIEAGRGRGDDFSRAYAETVFRNNLTTAYSAGIHEQMEREPVRRVIGALQFVAAMDSDTTPICRAANGTLAPAEHAIWEERTPPLHHNCRSGIHFVTRTDLKRMGRLTEDGTVREIIPNFPPPPDAVPQDGFGGRRT